MIIGRGMMAHAFSSYDTSREVMVFASGVSNSQETDETAFKREEDLLREYLMTGGDAVFVYFSTCSIYDPMLKKTPYVQHKLKMEKMIRRYARKYLIFRLPQVVGKTTSKTLVNALYNMIQSGQQFEIRTKAYRNLIDCEDAFRICSHIIDNGLFLNRIMNVASTVKIAAPRIVEIIQRVLDRQGNYVLVDKASSDYDIDLADIMPVIRTVGLQFDEQYPERVIRKYYAEDKG